MSSYLLREIILIRWHAIVNESIPKSMMDGTNDCRTRLQLFITQVDGIMITIVRSRWTARCFNVVMSTSRTSPINTFRPTAHCMSSLDL
jgi:hypothetical protein